LNIELIQRQRKSFWTLKDLRKSVSDGAIRWNARDSADPNISDIFVTESGANIYTTRRSPPGQESRQRVQAFTLALNHQTTHLIAEELPK
jgi:hypothetical protein